VVTVVEKPPLSLLVHAALAAEKVRVVCELRLSHLEKHNMTYSFTMELLDRARRFEDWVDDTVANVIKAHPTYA